MRRLSSLMLGMLLGVSVSMDASAGAADTPPDSPETIHVNAIRNPEVRKYSAIVAGLDAFERGHRMAPAADVLRFRVERRAWTDKTPKPGEAPLALRLEGKDGFVLPLTLNDAVETIVPRSSAALAADSELVLNRKRRMVRVTPLVRSPGLPDNVRRLGDLRLECQVMVAIGKEELGLMRTLFVNSVLLTPNWCSFFKAERDGFPFEAPERLARATLREGDRTKDLPVEGRSFRTAMNDPDWSDEALIELAFEPVTGTAGETPRTAP
ncbi:hypothetical protein RCH14_003392 [Massilia sp. MP_M2]|uniref:hypothetical protein n=1 Tax=Massilia sp. MP_M2 TaxID=3071713 RepID=UPI00319DBBCD